MGRVVKPATQMPQNTASATFWQMTAQQHFTVAPQAAVVRSPPH